MPDLLTRLASRPTVAYVAEVTAIAVSAAWLVALPIHSTAASIAAGVTAAWLAGIFLPCPCHRRGARR